MVARLSRERNTFDVRERKRNAVDTKACAIQVQTRAERRRGGAKDDVRENATRPCNDVSMMSPVASAAQRKPYSHTTLQSIAFFVLL